MDKIKNRHSALGAKKHCPQFAPCPLCFGCRNYNFMYTECQECAKDNKKYNVCDKIKHTDKALSMMIKPLKIVIGDNNI